MIYRNRTNMDFLPASTRGVDRGLDYPPSESIDEQAGLYYRSRIFPGLSTLVDQCLEGETPFSDLTVDAYQSWVERGWKAPHGTLHAAVRLREKGIEERHELDDALEEYWETGKKEHLLEEAGDNLWVATARSSNAGNVVGDSIKTRLYEYIAGTKVYESGTPEEPDWYDVAAQLAIKRGSPTVGDLDDVMRSGFVARISPAMNLFDDEQFSPTAAVFDLLMFNVGASGVNIRQHDREDGYPDISAATYEQLASDVGVFTSEAYFRITSLAHYAGSSLAKVVETNMRKINERLRDGLIDKSDGPRAAE